jgi:hypothetical protein
MRSSVGSWVVRAHSQRRWTQRLWFLFRSRDRRAKSLLDCVGVDALVIALLGDGAGEEHDAVSREMTRTSSTALTRIALATVTAGV